MIKAKLTDGAVLVGLSRVDCEKLLTGKSITLELAEMGLPAQRIIVLAGETDSSVVNAVTKQVPLQKGADVHLMSGDGFDPQAKPPLNG